MWWTLVASAAFGAPDQEIVVYGDDFARWDDTRWLVQSELLMPFPTLFAGDDTAGFRSHAFQVRAVLACSKEHRLSKRRWEVMCEVEDIGLQVTTQGRWRSPGEVAHIQSVLDEVDAQLTGAQVQLQVDGEGGLNNIDLEGISASNAAERAKRESLRQVVSRVMSGFHLRVPPHAQDSGRWIERNSQLMQMPSLTSSRGATRLQHDIMINDGLEVVQTAGDGTVAVLVPYSRSASADAPASNAPTATALNPKDEQDAQDFSRPLNGTKKDRKPFDATAHIEAPSDFVETEAAAEGNESELEATYAMSATGVALIDGDTGIMTERVWVVDGASTPSSAGGVQTAPFRNSGRLQLLGVDDHPDVGASEQVAPPTRTVAGLATWTGL